MKDQDSAVADVLLVSEREDHFHATRAALLRLHEGLILAWARTPAEAARRLAGNRDLIVLVDSEVDEGRGRSLVQHLTRQHPDAVFLTLCDAAPADSRRPISGETWDGLQRALSRGLAASLSHVEPAAAAMPLAAPPDALRVAIDAAEDHAVAAAARERGRRWDEAHDAQLRRLSAAVEQACEAICITDLDGCIEYVNRAACESSGYSAEELIGRAASILKSGHTAVEAYRSLWQSLKRGDTWRGVLFNRRKDGRVYVEAATITPVRDGDGRITSYLAVKEDVTEKRRMSDELDQYRRRLGEMVDQRTAELQRARAAAEAASTAKSAFLAAMSHEIRTPMNGVIGILEVLQRSGLNPYQSELAGTIGESAAALLRVIDDILDFSKIEAGRLTLERAAFDLEQLVESTCDTLHPLAAARGIELRAFVDPALPRSCMGDAHRLRQVLINLLGNAVKFSAGLPHRGRVSLRVQPGQGGRIAFVVRDNGIGMADAVRQRLFQPFAQGESSTTRSYGGTGLGLVISQRLAEAMGGRIGCSSQPGEGSVFQFELALDDDAADTGESSLPGTTASHGALAAQPLFGLRCLLLLDDAELAVDWTAYLGAAGAEVCSMPARPVAEKWTTGGLADCSNDEDTRTTVLLTTAQRLAMAVGPLPPTVRVQSGQRRAPRMGSSGHVLLDRDGLHRSMLLHAVAMAARRDVAPVPAAPTTDDWPALPEDLETAGSRGRVVLVAEDNEVNREVISHQLRFIGLACELVADGAEALARLRAMQQRYGLLLTDLHMPNLDGYDLAATIRADEAGEAGSRRLPIVALTANALRSEAERCLAVGIDDYLCKPIRLESLRQTLARRLPGADAAPAQPPAANGPMGRGDEPDFADSALVELIGRNADRLASVRREYLSSIEQADDELTRAVARSDWPTVAGVAHRLKSSSRWVGALAIARKFEELERAGLGADTSAIRALATDLGETLAEVREHFEALDSGVVDAAQLQRAIAGGELLLLYQPQAALADGGLVGVEALVRWQHPERGLLTPEAFVPVAEAHGLIDALTLAVIGPALAQCKAWRMSLGHAVRVSVKVPTSSLSRPDFAERVAELLDRHGVPAHDLMLEITESRLMRHRQTALEALARLRRCGTGLSIDDFGAGDSSLAKLRDLQFAELKIDRDFVQVGRGHATLRGIVARSVELARRLDLQVVAEGVEDQADWELVGQLGCDAAQGWFIARPMPADALPRWLREWTTRLSSMRSARSTLGPPPAGARGEQPDIVMRRIVG